MATVPMAIGSNEATATAEFSIFSGSVRVFRKQWRKYDRTTKYCAQISKNIKNLCKKTRYLFLPTCILPKK
jgi:hypothetical protein